MTKDELYSELSIQISCLDMKLNKILELLNVPEVTIDQDIRFTGAKPGHGASFIGVIDPLGFEDTYK